MEVNIHESWKNVLKTEFSKTYFKQIVTFIKAEKAAGKIIYPPGKFIFNAFELTHFDDLKVVILGQDPYHGAGQAHGLSFSVQQPMKPPPSLINIYKEIESDIGLKMDRTNGDLSHWAKQGVLLLNSVLTVRANEAFSHATYGWTEFTDAVIQKISDEKKGIVFILWGKAAQSKQMLIDETKHKVLKAAHPSPFAADKGFFGCKHFSKTNEYLMEEGKNPIDWKIN